MVGEGFPVSDKAEDLPNPDEWRARADETAAKINLSNEHTPPEETEFWTPQMEHKYTVSGKAPDIDFNKLDFDDN